MSDLKRFGIADSLAVVGRHKLVMALSIFGMVALIALPRVLRPRLYSATASFIPQNSQSNSSLAGFAAQFGVNVDTRPVTQTPDFYAEYIVSRPVLRRAVETTYDIPGANGARRRADLVSFLRVQGASDAEKLHHAVTALRNGVTPGIARQSGTVRLDVRLTDAHVAQQVAARLIELVNEFNVGARRTQAVAEREFVEARLNEVATELRTAENRLQSFLQRNRAYQGSPQLIFEYERLERDVTLRNALYTTVMQAYEQARVQEVRNTPVITVLEQPEVPVWPVPRRLASAVILGSIVGAAIGIVGAFALELMKLNGITPARALRRTREKQPA